MNDAVVSSAPHLSPYPWATLEPIPRCAVKCLTAFRRRTPMTDLAPRLCDALERWSGLPAKYERVRVTAGQEEPLEPRPRLLLRCAVFPFSVLICVDPRLCLKVTQRLTQQGDSPLDPLPPIETPLLGAVAALLSHLIDDLRLGIPIRVGWGHLPETNGQRAQVEGILHWGTGSYELIAVFDLPGVPTAEPDAPFDLSALDDLRLPLHLVVGAGRLDASELAKITVGSVFLPGEDLWIDDQGLGRGLLVTTDGPWAYPCTLVGSGKIVLGAHAVNRDQDTLGSSDVSIDGAHLDTETTPKSLKDVLADCPLTLEVELCAVTLPARELARLAPGDIIETQANLGEPVTLRVSGRAVARAELVNIEGQVGLRIREIYTGESR